MIGRWRYCRQLDTRNREGQTPVASVTDLRKSAFNSPTVSDLLEPVIGCRQHNSDINHQFLLLSDLFYIGRCIVWIWPSYNWGLERGVQNR
jgi:hypothetical protein